MGPRLSLYILEKIKLTFSSWDSNPGQPSPYPSRCMCVYTVYQHMEESDFELT